jgi:hypothetical protein
MHLHEWLKKNKVKMCAMAKDIDVHVSMIENIAYKTRRANLFTAFKIYKYTAGEVYPEALLLDDEYNFIKNLKQYEKPKQEEIITNVEKPKIKFD